MPEPAPHRAWLDRCARRELAYQSTPDGTPVWPPRVAAPGTGEELSWRTSAGTGTVYAAAVCRPRGSEPYSVVLVELDEGFRMMSSVRGIAPEAVRPGLRVRVAFADGEDGPVPCFEPAA